ncbi:protein odr-4 homolog [Sinocyclocheilus grahami]|uniref:protein odr-4 homolog n=1 Tax=Sinocyclocheilus grahami TaxID=75366 RepID=UPI0007ACFE87|nr:PREDICTED: protein odr-4 homolog [Sinocyclocheilus grahami]
MGRSYFVDEAVEEYLSGLQAAPGSCVTGLLAGQSSPQRDFVVLAVQTPHRESEGQPKASRGVSPLDDIDVEWVTEHAKQVSRMLPGGLCIFFILQKDFNNSHLLAIKRDIINTVCSRVEMFLEDLLINEGSQKGLCSGQQALPRRVFAPMPISGLSVCDYMFPDESTADVAERLKEMLDCETPEEDIDTSLESNQLFSTVSGSEITYSHDDDPSKHVISEIQAENPRIQKAPQYYAGVAVAAAIALLATATSLLYFS